MITGSYKKTLKQHNYMHIDNTVFFLVNIGWIGWLSQYSSGLGVLVFGCEWVEIHIICTAHFNLSSLYVMQFTKYPKPGQLTFPMELSFNLDL